MLYHSGFFCFKSMACTTHHNQNIICPFCKCSARVKHVSNYKRMVIDIITYRRKEQVISISRFFCAQCNRSWTLPPDYLLPYTSYTLYFIDIVLRDYYSRKKTVRALCDYWQISCSTLYGWIHKYGNQL